MLLLFQGDSITDCGRSRQDDDSLGYGFPGLIAGALHSRHDLRILNRGIAGDTTSLLLSRWQSECLALSPDLLILLIGINDCWRGFDSNLKISPEAYAANYHKLLSSAIDALPNCKIIVMEPFLLHVSEERMQMRPDLNEKINIGKQIVHQLGLTYIPLDSIFADASVQRPPSFWASDGVHPTAAGHWLITQEILKVV